MVGKIDHLGMAVRSLPEARRFYEQVLGLAWLGEEEVPSQKVRVAFFACGETRIELLTPTAEDSPVARFLAKKGEGLHHVAFRTDDLDQTLSLARAAGGSVVGEAPTTGAGGKRVAFLHPHSTHGVLVELCSEDREPRAPTAPGT